MSEWRPETEMHNCLVIMFPGSVIKVPPLGAINATGNVFVQADMLGVGIPDKWIPEKAEGDTG